MLSFVHIFWFGFISFSAISDGKLDQKIPENTIKNEVSLQDSLNHWDQVVEQLKAKSLFYDRGDDRLRAYLFDAQKKYVEIALATGDMPSNVDQISLFVIQLFCPNYEEKLSHARLLSEPVRRLQHDIEDRFNQEQAHIERISISRQGNGWQGKMPYHGLEIPNWKPWTLTSVSEFRLPAPPQSSDPFWQDQIRLVKEQMANANESNKKRILYWANMTGQGSGDWVTILNEYMKKAKVPILKQLEVRDALGKAIVDSTIAAFDSKYSYLVKRPYMLDSNLKTYIDTPNHPSFPSAHSTTCAAVLEILQYYLPENQAEWQKLVEEGGMSRIWAGIHFPVDHQAGKMLGKKVGQAVLNQTLKEDSLSK